MYSNRNSQQNESVLRTWAHRTPSFDMNGNIKIENQNKERNDSVNENGNGIDEAAMINPAPKINKARIAAPGPTIPPLKILSARKRSVRHTPQELSEEQHQQRLKNLADENFRIHQGDVVNTQGNYNFSDENDFNGERETAIVQPQRNNLSYDYNGNNNTMVNVKQPIPIPMPIPVKRKPKPKTNNMTQYTYTFEPSISSLLSSHDLNQRLSGPGHNQRLEESQRRPLLPLPPVSVPVPVPVSVPSSMNNTAAKAPISFAPVFSKPPTCPRSSFSPMNVTNNHNRSPKPKHVSVSVSESPSASFPQYRTGFDLSHQTPIMPTNQSSGRPDHIRNSSISYNQYDPLSLSTSVSTASRNFEDASSMMMMMSDLEFEEDGSVISNRNQQELERPGVEFDYDVEIDETGFGPSFEFVNVQEGQGITRTNNSSRKLKSLLKNHKQKLSSLKMHPDNDYKNFTNKRMGKYKKESKVSFADENNNVENVDSIQNGTKNENNDGTNKIDFPDVSYLLENCECFMNWINAEALSRERVERLVQIAETKYIFPNESFDWDETIKWNCFEHNSYLGIVAFFNIELSRFKEAKRYIVKGKAFTDTCVERGSLPPALAASFDYIWDYVCLYGSVIEWQVSGMMDVFPEMNLFALALSFRDLPGNIQAGVYCVKSYFYKLLRYQVGFQIQALRKTVTLEPNYYEWYICLQEALRIQRLKFKEFHTIYPWDAEIQAVWTAIFLSNSSNPRCLLASINLLSEIAKAQFGSSRWPVIRFGNRNFHGFMELKPFIKEMAERVMKQAPRSIRINTKLAQIFMSGWPYGHRDFRIGKDCLDRALKYHPDSCKANYRMAEYYVSVDTNHRRAEIYYTQALGVNEKSFPSLTGIIQIMLRSAEHRKEELFGVLDTQLNKVFWELKQLAILHYYKGLALILNGEAKNATESFITALVMHDKSLIFQELPSQHRRFGWPGWPATSKLTFGHIRSELLKEKMRSDPDRKKLITLILKQITEAEGKENRSVVIRKKWKS